MSIVTRAGDKGKTSLCGGTRVRKDDIRVETLGALDEVSSFLGMAKSCAGNRKTKSIADSIQKELIVLSSEIAAPSVFHKKWKKRIGKDSVCAVEKEIRGLERGRLVKIRSFCLPGRNMASASLDIARAITRRAERRCVTMAGKNMLKNRDIIIYLNRLSDLLFLLARFNEKKKI